MSTDRITQHPDLADDALQSIVDLVIDIDPTANREQVAVAVIELVPTAQWCKALAKKLTARPELLTGAGAEGAPVVIKLIGKLRALGVASVIPPACPFCDRVLVLSRRRDGLRCCKTCWDTAHAKPYARCGTVTRLDRRTAAGESLCWSCAEAEPELQETCTGCGRITLACRRDGDAVFCKNCCKPPTTTCSICGRTKPCYQAGTDAPRCKNCSDNLRAQPCVECGQVRVVSRRNTVIPRANRCARTADPWISALAAVADFPSGSAPPKQPFVRSVTGKTRPRTAPVSVAAPPVGFTARVSARAAPGRTWSAPC